MKIETNYYPLNIVATPEEESEGMEIDATPETNYEQPKIEGDLASKDIVDTIEIADVAVTPIKVSPSLRSSSHDLVFSASDADTVAWASGTITLADGSSYSIDAGNTGDMTARTYIYLDINVSATVLQISTTFSDAVGENKILIASAEDGTGEATFYVLGGIGGANIDANSIIVSNLAAINADMGAITAGTITIDTAGHIKGGQTAYNTGTGFFLGYSTDAYKFSVGNPAGNYITWDGSNLTVNGYALSSDIEYATGDTVIKSAATERSFASSTSYVKKKEISIAKGGTLRIKFDMRMQTDATEMFGQIYRNGVAVGTEQSQAEFTYTTYSEDISGWSKGDLVQLYIKATTGSETIYIKNFNLYSDSYEISTVILD